MQTDTDLSLSQCGARVLAAGVMASLLLGVGAGCQTYEEPVHGGPQSPMRPQPEMQPQREAPVQQPQQQQPRRQQQPAVEGDW